MGSNSSTRFAGFWQNTDACAVERSVQAAGVKLGSNPLNYANMVWLGIGAGLDTARISPTSSSPPSVVGGCLPVEARSCAFQTEAACLEYNPHGKQVLDERGSFRAGVVGMPMDFWSWLILLLVQRFQVQHPAAVRWKGFRFRRLDGTEIALPYWKTLAQTFGTSRNGRRRRRPQRRMLMLAFPQCRLPWCYDLTPRSCHEQTSVARLVEYLEPRDLLLMDRAFKLWAVLANPTPTGIFRHPAASRRIAENVEKPRPDDRRRNGKCPKRRGKSARGKACPSCRNRRRCGWSAITWPAFVPVPWSPTCSIPKSFPARIGCAWRPPTRRATFWRQACTIAAGKSRRCFAN